MKKFIISSIQSVDGMSYSDFIGFINQWNTPPGSYSTISKLAIFSQLNNKSNLLEVGCSTGFSSREFCTLTGCKGLGIDISKNSIVTAIYNKDKYASKIKIDYRVVDGHEFQVKNKFSHIMVGGNLKFFDNPDIMMAKCLDMLKDGGIILATPYYEIKKMPKRIASKVETELGIPMTAFNNFSYKYVMKMFNKFEIVFEERNSLTQETDEEIKYYVQSVISRACKINSINDLQIQKAMERRLFKIRKLINITRKYQEYVILVLRYRKSVYPNRYTALF